MERVLKKRLRHFLLCNFRPLCIWGTGFIQPGGHYSSRFLEVFALRGALSLQRIKVNNPIVLGDPGLLSSKLFPQNTVENDTILLMPHLHDENSDAWIAAFRKLFPDRKIEILSLQEDVQIILNKIANAALVVSSAMHPLIVAHSYRTPTVWVELFGANTHSGGRYKFEDYYSVTGLAPRSILDRDICSGKVARSDIEYLAETSIIDDAHLSGSVAHCGQW